MFALRCTQRLPTRLKVVQTEFAAAEPTTLLGDWYGNLLHIGRVQLVLAVSERTFLPVVLPAAPVSSVVTRLHSSVGDMLRALRLDAASIDRELAEMGTVVLGRTASHQLTGILVDFARGLDLYREHEPSLIAPVVWPARGAEYVQSSAIALPGSAPPTFRDTLRRACA